MSTSLPRELDRRFVCPSGRLRRSKTALSQATRLAANSITLAVGDTFTKSTTDNITYGAGVRLAGLDLNANTSYTTISKLWWKGVTSGCQKYLYGANTDPVQAKEVQASSTC